MTINNVLLSGRWIEEETLLIDAYPDVAVGIILVDSKLLNINKEVDMSVSLLEIKPVNL